MNETEISIGKNIREVRLNKGISQAALAEKCDISKTTLSAYENDYKTPGLTTLAHIAKELNVSIDRLYYGDVNNNFIASESDDGKKIVNSVYLLWSLGVVDYFENNMSSFSVRTLGEMNGTFLTLTRFSAPIKRFINALNEFNKNKSTYSQPENYLEMIKSSVANEIDVLIENEQKNTDL